MSTQLHVYLKVLITWRKKNQCLFSCCQNKKRQRKVMMNKDIYPDIQAAKQWACLHRHEREKEEKSVFLLMVTIKSWAYVGKPDWTTFAGTKDFLSLTFLRLVHFLSKIWFLVGVGSFLAVMCFYNETRWAINDLERIITCNARIKNR
jgi:hypothetical protein